MIDIRRLLSDPIYKAYFLKAPKLPPAARALGDPFYVYVQREPHGRWARTSAANYRDAYAVLKQYLPGVHDVVIVSRRVAFGPPTRTVKVTKNGKPKMVQTPSGPQQETRIVEWSWGKLLDMEGGDRPHRWCPYCRRPTEFRYFPRHHAFKNAPVPQDPTRPRCTVCGCSEDLARNGAHR